MNKNLLSAVTGRSSTINSLVGVAPASVLLIWILGQFGINMPPEIAATVVAVIMMALGIGMRFLTTRALHENLPDEQKIKIRKKIAVKKVKPKAKKEKTDEHSKISKAAGK